MKMFLALNIYLCICTDITFLVKQKVKNTFSFFGKAFFSLRVGVYQNGHFHWKFWLKKYLFYTLFDRWKLEIYILKNRRILIFIFYKMDCKDAKR